MPSAEGGAGRRSQGLGSPVTVQGGQVQRAHWQPEASRGRGTERDSESSGQPELATAADHHWHGLVAGASGVAARAEERGCGSASATTTPSSRGPSPSWPSRWAGLGCWGGRSHSLLPPVHVGPRIDPGPALRLAGRVALSVPARSCSSRPSLARRRSCPSASPRPRRPLCGMPGCGLGHGSSHAGWPRVPPLFVGGSRRSLELDDDGREGVGRSEAVKRRVDLQGLLAPVRWRRCRLHHRASPVRCAKSPWLQLRAAVALVRARKAQHSALCASDCTRTNPRSSPIMSWKRASERMTRKPLSLLD